MPDLETPPADRPPTPPAPAQDPADGPDPLAHLHKMSTTAGLGSTDYVAINTPSIIAVILGLASALAIFDKILLVVPLAGVICAVVALYQIRRSGGTQTGTGLAVVGLLLSLGFVGYVGYSAMQTARQARADRAAIEAILKQLTGHIQKGEFQQAYALFSPRFQDRVPEPQFADIMKYVQNGSWGKLEWISTNGRYDFNSDPSTGIRVGQALLFMKLDKYPDASRQDGYFRLVGGQWKIENIPGIFPDTINRPGAAGGTGGEGTAQPGGAPGG